MLMNKRLSILSRNSQALYLGFICIFAGATANAGSSPLKYSLDLLYDHNSFGGALFDDIDEDQDHVDYLRRLKLKVNYELNNTVRFKLSSEYNRKDDVFGLDDAYTDIRLNDRWSVLAGKFKEPFGLDNHQSLSTQYTMERSVATKAFTFGRNVGAQLAYSSDLWQWQFAITQVKAIDPEYSNSFAYTTRVSAAPIAFQQGFMHIGLGYTTREGSEKKFDIDEKLIAPGVGNLVSSPKLRPDNIDSSNIEFAARYKAFLVQSEYFTYHVSERSGGTQTFWGYYNTAVWTIHGKKRDYRNGEVKFDDSGKHLLELAFRQDFVDLESGYKGDKAESFTVGLNYYYKGATRLSLEYQDADVWWLKDTTFHLVSGHALNLRMQLLL